MNTLPILYSFRRCPYAMRARMAIHASGINVYTIEVSLKNKPQSLLDCSPKATVPVLVTTQGQVIDESRDIMHWALNQFDPGNWLLKHDTINQQHMTDLVDICDQDFKPLLDRYKYFDRYPEYSQNDYRIQAEFFIEKLELRLQKHHFLMDDNIRFADIAIFPFIRQFSGVDKTWFYQTQYHNVQRWLDTCLNTPLFNAIMKSS